MVNKLLSFCAIYITVNPSCEQLEKHNLVLSVGLQILFQANI